MVHLSYICLYLHIVSVIPAFCVIFTIFEFLIYISNHTMHHIVSYCIVRYLIVSYHMVQYYFVSYNVCIVPWPILCSCIVLSHCHLSYSIARQCYCTLLCALFLLYPPWLSSYCWCSTADRTKSTLASEPGLKIQDGHQNQSTCDLLAVRH